MRFFNNRHLLAVSAVTLISRNECIASKEVCRTLGVRSRHLESVLQTITSHGVLKSTRGPRGGYALRMRATDIKVRFVIDIVDSMMTPEVDRLTNCDTFIFAVHPVLAPLETQMLAIISNLTIQQINDRDAKYLQPPEQLAFAAEHMRMPQAESEAAPS